MANQKDTPNLPGSSRMQMPSGSASGTNRLIKEDGGLKKNSNGITRKITAAASGKGMGGKNPYPSNC